MSEAVSDPYPFKFNVQALEYEDVAAYLRAVPKSRWRIDTREMIGELTIEEWRQVKAFEAHQDALACHDDHHVTDLAERTALVDSDSDHKVEITVQGMPSTASRRLLNRVAIQGGVNNAGITRDNWSAAFTRGAKGYLVQFYDKSDAILFKLAMWKRPDEDARL